MTKKTPAIAYFRTSSRTNVGPDKDSERRQREAVAAYAKSQRLDVVAEFYDAAVSGAKEIDERPGFVALLKRCVAEGVNIVLVENASRFARDLSVQLTGHAMMKQMGIELVPVDAPTHFTDPTPTAVMVQQILGAVSQFEKSNLVKKLSDARNRKFAKTGRCEGRIPPPPETVALAKKLARKSPKTGERRSYRAISAELAKAHMVTPAGKPYHPYSVQLMLTPYVPTRLRKNAKAAAFA